MVCRHDWVITLLLILKLFPKMSTAVAQFPRPAIVLVHFAASSDKTVLETQLLSQNFHSTPPQKAEQCVSGGRRVFK